MSSDRLEEGPLLMPADFGLTDDVITRHRVRSLRRVPLAVGCVGPLAAAVASIVWNRPTDLNSWIGAGFAAAFFGLVGWFGSVALWLAATTVPRWALTLLIPAWRQRAQQLSKYEAAMAAYGAAQKEQLAAELRARRDFWLALDGHRFEHELGALYRRLGYDVTVTKGSGDEGIDLLLVRGGVTTVVQCKAHAMPVGPGVVRELWGAMHAHGAERCMLASLGGFTAGVRTFANGKAIELVNVDDVLALQSQVQTSDRAGARPA